MKIERAKNTKKNVFSGMINKIVTLFLPFVTRTIIIKTIGIEYLGLNSLFAAILQVLNLTELGFSSAIVFCLYRPIAEDDIDTINALLNFFKNVYRIIGGVVTIVGISIIPFLPNFIKGNIPSDINIYFVYLIYLVNTILSYTFFSYKTVIPTALQRNDILSNISTFSYGMMYIAQVVVLVALKNYYPYIILMPIFTLFNNILISRWVDRTYPQFRCFGNISSNMKKQIKIKVSGLMINKICQTSRNSLDSIFVSYFLGLTATAIYNNYFYVINALISISLMVTTSMAAGVGNSVVVESRNKNYDDMKKINFIYMWISGWSFICLVCLFQPFMEIWVGSQNMFDFKTAVLFSLYFYFLKMGDIRGLYADSAGLWWENRYRAVAESIANIVLNFVLGKYFGVYGIISATIISLLIINFGFGSGIVFKYYFKNGKLIEYFTKHLIYFVVSSSIALLTFLICNILNLSGMNKLIYNMIICIIIPNILFYLIYHRTDDYNNAVGWLLKKIKSSK